MSDFLQLFYSPLVNFVVYVRLFVVFCSLLQSISNLFQSFLVCKCQIPFQGMHLPFLVKFPWYDDCSPFSQLSKCVAITLFGVVFTEKNTKNKKKAGSEKNLLPYISTMGELQNIIQTDLGSYSKGLQLSFFFYFWNLVM